MTTAQYDMNDPRLTAFALGELEPAEMAQIERDLGSNPALRSMIDDIRATAQVLRAEFAAEAPLHLTDDQRLAIEERRAPQVEVIRRPFAFRARQIWAVAGLAAAACLALMLALPLMRNQVDDQKYAVKTEQQSASGKEEARSKDKDQGNAVVLDALAAEKMTGELSAASGVRPGEAAAGREGPTRIAGGGGALRAPTPSVQTPPSSPPPPPPGMSRQLQTDPGERAQSAPTDAETESTASTAVEDTRARADEADLAKKPLDDFNRDSHALIIDNPFFTPSERPVSTFSVDVDTASYSYLRGRLNQRQLPPKDAVRIEEMVNYFSYAYEPPTGDVPFSANIEVASAPWNPKHRLVRIGLQGKHVRLDMRPPTSLVFLIDVSGSMNQPDKLPLAQQALSTLVQNLTADDRIAIVTYAGSAGIALDSLYCTPENKPRILNAIQSLRAGGGTHGSAGILQAYDLAQQHFIQGGVNRVILCTDGDFNIGVSSDAELVRLIEEKRESGVWLSVLGFGTGNFQASKMEQLADHGNGNFAYLDTIDEAEKVLVDQMCGTLITIAKDVKLQVEFNPAKVGAYRLIGYENRVLEAQDFRNDKKDAGEIGAGHTVTALYEIVPAGNAVEFDPRLELRFRKADKDVAADVPDAVKDELLAVAIRYKQPDAAASEAELLFPVKDSGINFGDATADFKFAASVAAFGMLLRDSPHKGEATFAKVLDWSANGLSTDDESERGRRAEFQGLIRRARELIEGRLAPGLDGDGMRSHQ